MKLFSLLAIFAVTLSSFGGNDKVFTNADKWIPTGFDTRKSILLVANFDIGGNKNAQKACAKVTEDMKAEMKADYPYKFEFASWADIEKNEKYADKDLYRYALLDGNTSTEVLGGTGRSSNVFHIYDRKVDKHYPNTGKPDAYVIQTMKPTVLTVVKYLKELKEPAADPASKSIAH